MAQGLSSYRTSAAVPAVTEVQTVGLFVQGAVLGRTVYAVVGDDGIAAVPSPGHPERSTYLFWSHQHEADRWADVLAQNPNVVAIGLPAFLGTTLPALHAAGGLGGLDWSSEPIEPEIAAAALGAHLREELVRDFAAVACKTRTVWMLEDTNGIASLETPEGTCVVPLWADRHLAEAAVAASGRSDVLAMRKPLLELANRYLLSPEGLKMQLAPGYVHATGAIALSAWALKALLNGGGRPSSRIAAVA
jgi:hypothetical protein